MTNKRKINKIIVMGYMGCRRCYLNIGMEEAIRRYCATNSYTREDYDIDGGLKIESFEFDDEFEAYDIWEID